MGGADFARGVPVIRRLVCVSANAAVDKIVAVDRLVPGAIHRPAILSVLPGGKAVNVARAAARLGLPSSVVAVLAGRAGSWIAAELADRGIPVRAVAVAGESRTCVSILDRQAGTLTELYEPGVALDAAGWDALETAVEAELAVDPGGTLAVLAGSMPPGSPADGYGRLAVLAARRGAAAVVDAGGHDLAAALSARPWLVKVNVTEAMTAVEVGGPGAGRVAMGPGRAAADRAGIRASAAGGVDEDELAAAAAAAGLRALGADVVLVTRGVLGALLATDQGTWRIGPPPERGPFAVGSGDAFLAGFTGALAGGADLPEAARHGAAVATANALTPGQGEFDPAAVARVLSRITIARIA